MLFVVVFSGFDAFITTEYYGVVGLEVGGSLHSSKV